MGFAPDAVDAMSLWQLAACVDGWRRANGGDEKPPPPTAEEHDAMLEKWGPLLMGPGAA